MRTHIDTTSIRKFTIMHPDLMSTAENATSDRNPEEGGSLDQDEDEEDIGHLWDGALSIASNVVANAFESSRLSDLKYITHGGYNHVWLVVYSTVCDLPVLCPRIGIDCLSGYVLRRLPGEEVHTSHFEGSAFTPTVSDPT